MTRRHFLKTFGGGTALAAGAAGCAERVAPVSLLAAGSLAHFAEHRLRPSLAAHGVPLQHETLGSAAVARLVASGRRQPDLVALADPALFRGPRTPPWHALSATNALVIACARTEGGRRVRPAGRDGWFRPILKGDARLGRTDPDADPLGYRALFLFALAAVAYRNMAVERDYPFVSLPPELDLIPSALAPEGYASVSYALPGGKTVTGGPIRYAATVLDERPAAWRAFHALTDPEALRAAGFGVPPRYPRFRGNAPAAAE